MGKGGIKFCIYKVDLNVCQGSHGSFAPFRGDTMSQGYAEFLLSDHFMISSKFFLHLTEEG